ncbi:MAG TPA: TIGR01459 family HAD-type hydrolase [Acidocella sp.]|jgi:HAD superfamily hydrolase (TIGR01459 family)|uniref:TIGR01459 family HAD-type hydrolase n=1 Tax=Acidocella sp. TaxID=50710 RepID=UPI002BBFED0F|nr:TIGR01459 family HAD-type hydrolase [Acidocella sp.]HVE22551.1 TIGR01459 family HAD-type hydrolase [Acidocella sp.]
MSGFGRLSVDYDGFIVDLWGVVHDGVKPYPGVLDCLARLRGAGKRVVFLSNAPRRADKIAEALADMGITRDFYDAIMSSGEAVYQALRDRTDEFAALGNTLYHLGPPRDRGLFDTLPLREASSPAAADFILNTGPDDILGPQDPSVYQPVLDEGLKHEKPMVCANPDLEVIRDGQRIICAGLLAEIYESAGGKVIQRGKPDPAIYAPTLALLGTERRRTLAVGDSLRTDMAGAKAARIDACWVLSGIHALRPEEAPQEAEMAGITPTAILPGLVW